MNKNIKEWLLEGPPWIKYAVEKQLLHKNLSPILVNNSNEIKNIVDFLTINENGLQSVINGNASYNKEVFWYLYFLSDIGFSSDDLSLQNLFREIIKLQSENNRFVLSKEMKPDYFCISSILLSSMVRMSEECRNKIKAHVELLISKQRLDGGWHCAKNRAIGCKLENSESCPMDNLNILMLFSEYEEFRNDPRLNGAIDLLLSHWERRDEAWRPYGFGIGTQFKKLRYPEAKYSILRVLDVLSMYPYAIRSDAFKSMLSAVKEKSSNGKYTADSVMKSFSDFDFGQKKESSRWITFLIERIEKRSLE